MRVRFGYVAQALSIWDGSTAKTLTFTRWSKMKKTEREDKLKEVTFTNLQNTMRAIHYNIAHQIHLYRMSSSIVPLATHPEAKWPYRDIFAEEFAKIGKLVKEANMRVSLHPNQFTLFTSDKEHVTTNAVTDMEYHYDMFEAMGLTDEGVINIHVGGSYGDKSAALERFYKNIKKLPADPKSCMTLENDDKTYTAEETLDVCQHEHIPMVFDYHHHWANLSETPLEDLLPKIFATWDNHPFPPKVHISSPKSDKDFRHHANFVDMAFLEPFFQVVHDMNIDFDVMIEAKEKDRAMLALVDDLSRIRGVKRIDGSTLEW
ncbi:UV DNA damage repair endonuclease UvsE [Bacillus sp. HMF5848]|uniref:UV DNA damage repair endonuclease UvsE n=1 Tax=Bacillus sp. HMF5848 TaxID=2495421 RepID=UPI000F76D5C6|nr:UV DNA damage repair endonuclease UvsE [Bacillus sp. HMF5848]RSK29464.1 UV DNA damage repair endonuclease UvsE [Bacillus sp. HMF5848]